MNLFVTVVLRSYNRLGELRALVQNVLGQDHPHFEVLIVDSTPGVTEEDIRRAIGVSDDRLRVVQTPARGCAAAANVGMRHALGDVVASVDDDDVPVGSGWLSALTAPLADPLCLGVNGRMDYVGEGEARVPRVRSGWLRDRWMLSYGPFKKPRVFPGSPNPKRGIAWLTGGNAALRREAWARGGAWDEFIGYHNEHSLFLRLAHRMKPGEYLAYAPEARMLIRRDVAGGLEHRTVIDPQERVDTVAKYYLWLVAREYPLRVWGLLPVFFPYYLLDAGIHAAEQAEHSRADLVRQFVKGVKLAPGAFLRHALRSPE